MGSLLDLTCMLGWLASRLGDKKWFLFFLTFQLCLGIPEIIYIQKDIDTGPSDSDQGKTQVRLSRAYGFSLKASCLKVFLSS